MKNFHFGNLGYGLTKKRCGDELAGFDENYIICEMKGKLLNRKKKRYLFEENIYFSAKQICLLLGISASTLSKQLKHVLAIPGCKREVFRRTYCFGKPKPYGHNNIRHYNLNTAVAIAYRVNNQKCKEFLKLYHGVMMGLCMRLVGANYYIPTILEWHEFLADAKLYTPPLDLGVMD